MFSILSSIKPKTWPLILGQAIWTGDVITVNKSKHYWTNSQRWYFSGIYQINISLTTSPDILIHLRLSNSLRTNFFYSWWIYNVVGEKQSILFVKIYGFHSFADFGLNGERREAEVHMEEFGDLHCHFPSAALLLYIRHILHFAPLQIKCIKEFGTHSSGITKGKYWIQNKTEDRCLSAKRNLSQFFLCIF